jgi:hypothetical protein
MKKNGERRTAGGGESNRGELNQYATVGHVNVAAIPWYAANKSTGVYDKRYATGAHDRR